MEAVTKNKRGELKKRDGGKMLLGKTKNSEGEKTKTVDSFLFSNGWIDGPTRGQANRNDFTVFVPFKSLEKSVLILPRI